LALIVLFYFSLEENHSRLKLKDLIRARGAFPSAQIEKEIEREREGRFWTYFLFNYTTCCLFYICAFCFNALIQAWIEKYDWQNVKLD
jgi:hypothetical protein